MSGRLTTVLRCLAIAVFLVYVTWNAYWLSQFSVPPSLFMALTGQPCPTTGGTRALLCLFNGNLGESLRLNAMAIPIVLMFAATVLVLAYRLLSQRSLTVPSWFLQVWLVLLLVAWVIKLVGSPNYW